MLGWKNRFSSFTISYTIRKANSPVDFIAKTALNEDYVWNIDHAIHPTPRSILLEMFRARSTKEDIIFRQVETRILDLRLLATLWQVF